MTDQREQAEFVARDPNYKAEFLATELLGWKWRSSGKIVGWVQTDGTHTESRQLIDLYAWQGAGEIIEAMRERGFQVQLYGFKDSKSQPWTAEFCGPDKPDGDWDQWSVESDSLPQAILSACYSALKGESDG